MSVLDRSDRWAAVDPASMRKLLEGFPEQVRAAVGACRNRTVPAPGDVRSLIVTGLGGSAIGGDLVQSVAGGHLGIPYVVNRDYDLPRFVDRYTLVIACSYSGNTEETLSSYNQAKSAGASVLCITSGGQLEARAKADGYPVFPMPGGLPPRAALGHSFFTLLGALQALGLIPDMTGDIEETVALLESLKDRYRPENPEAQNVAKRIAESLHNRIVAVYGSSAILGATALRWRSQMEENAKTLALHHVLPEMNHNELVGWRFPDAALKQVGVLLLRDREDHPQVQRRFELTKEIITGKAGALHEVWTEGDSTLARVMSLVYLGDYVSLYLSYLNDVDPTPVDVIDYLKKKLSDLQ